MAKIFVICEAGSSWRFGDDHRANAFLMIHYAQIAGCQAIKFQWTSKPEQMAASRGMPGRTEFYRKWLCYPWQDLHDFWQSCKAQGIEFMCTGYVPEDVAVIARYVERFKVSSYEATNQALLTEYIEADKPVIVSHGLGTKPHAFATNLLCVSKYPASPSEYNLERLRSGEFQGASDHTACIEMGAIWAAAGAKVIEVHARLSDTPVDNPDFPHSLRINGTGILELKNYIEGIRLVESMTG